MDSSKALKIPSRSDKIRAAVRGPYILLALGSYLLIILMVFFYLKQDPVYSSELSLVLPGSGSSSNFSIENVGQANAQTKAPFSGGDFNPRVNYREILKSRTVLSNAAERSGSDAEQFGSPKVDLTQQTSILSISVSGSSPDNAQDKAWALYEAFQQRLDDLRADEAMRHSDGVMRAMHSYEIQLSEKRKAVLAFQDRSMLISQEQLDQATQMLSQLNEKYMYIQSDVKSRENYVGQLSNDLGVSPSLAGKAFALNTDRQFRGYLKELDESAAQISSYKSYWGAKHPKVKAEEKRFESATKALYVRSVDIVGVQTAKMLHTMDLTVSPNRAKLFADLVESYAQLQADKARLDELSLAKDKVSDRLRVYAREAAELERLEREAKLAEAVYTSAAARLDAGKADVFASYPVVQILTPPTEPAKQKSPKPALGIAGGLAGIFMVTFGLLIVWQRDYLIAKLLKRS